MGSELHGIAVFRQIGQTGHRVEMGHPSLCHLDTESLIRDTFSHSQLPPLGQRTDMRLKVDEPNLLTK